MQRSKGRVPGNWADEREARLAGKLSVVVEGEKRHSIPSRARGTILVFLFSARKGGVFFVVVVVEPRPNKCSSPQRARREARLFGTGSRTGCVCGCCGGGLLITDDLDGREVRRVTSRRRCKTDPYGRHGGRYLNGAYYTVGRPSV